MTIADPRLVALERDVREDIMTRLVEHGVLTPSGHGEPKDVAHACAVVHTVVVDLLYQAGVRGTGITFLMLDAQRHVESSLTGPGTAPAAAPTTPAPANDNAERMVGVNRSPVVVDLAAYRKTRQVVAHNPEIPA